MPIKPGGPRARRTASRASVPRSFEQELEQAKQASAGQLLLKCARLLNEQAITAIRERTGQTYLRTSHTALLPHIDLEGTRLSELARRLDVSKQAVGQLVEDLETTGMVERVADPTDRRAKRVRFTEQGRNGLLEGMQVLGEFEQRLRDEVGADAMRVLRRALLTWVQQLEASSERHDLRS